MNMGKLLTRINVQKQYINVLRGVPNNQMNIMTSARADMVGAWVDFEYNEFIDKQKKLKENGFNKGPKGWMLKKLGSEGQ